MRRRPSILAAAILLAALTVAVPLTHAETSLKRAAASSRHERDFVPRQVLVKFSGERYGRVVPLPGRAGVRRAAAALRSNPRVAYAAPNYIATASARQSESGLVLPDDPGSLTPPAVPGGWVLKQWNFLPLEGPSTPPHPASPGGIDAIGAWEHLANAGRPGAAGITVAVLDTGIAYRPRGSGFLRSPDFTSDQFVPGYDFIDHNKLPLDRNGHGTHIAGTIAEKTDNEIGLTGLAYNAKLMPVRVLNRYGEGNAKAIAHGIRFAVAHGADVINMSFNFDCGKHVPAVNEELRRAYRAGVVTVASIGNAGSELCISSPATGPHVIGVGGTTEGGCLGKYSLRGRRIDVLAPGGGKPVIGCPSISARAIFQVTFNGEDPREFGEPDGYTGTSMAAAHVSGVAAMILASGVLSPELSPTALVSRVTQRLRNTARSLGLPPSEQGAGLIDASRATDPNP